MCSYHLVSEAHVEEVQGIRGGVALEDEEVFDHKLLFLGPPDAETRRGQLLGPPVPHVNLLHIGEWGGVWVE